MEAIELEAVERHPGGGAPASASLSDPTGCFGMRLAQAIGRSSDHSTSLFMTSGIIMHLESTIIERVEICVRHPVFAGSDKAMDLVLEDLETMVESGRIHEATYRRLRQMILRSPHFASEN